MEKRWGNPTTVDTLVGKPTVSHLVKKREELRLCYHPSIGSVVDLEERLDSNGKWAKGYVRQLRRYELPPKNIEVVVHALA